MGDDEYGMDYNEDYFGAEEQENADFAHDTDEHNMYPTEDGFWTNQEPSENEPLDDDRPVQPYHADWSLHDEGHSSMTDSDNTNELESDHFFGAE